MTNRTNNVDIFRFRPKLHFVLAPYSSKLSLKFKGLFGSGPVVLAQTFYPPPPPQHKFCWFCRTFGQRFVADCSHKRCAAHVPLSAKVTAGAQLRRTFSFFFIIWRKYYKGGGLHGDVRNARTYCDSCEWVDEGHLTVPPLLQPTR